jgi:hypothetical protein
MQLTSNVYPSKIKKSVYPIFLASTWDSVKKQFMLLRKLVVKIIWSKLKLKWFYNSS